MYAVLFVCYDYCFVQERSHDKAEWTKTLRPGWRASLSPPTLARPSEVRLVMKWPTFRGVTSPPAHAGSRETRDRKPRVSNHFRRSVFFDRKDRRKSSGRTRRTAAKRRASGSVLLWDITWRRTERPGLTRTWTDWRGSKKNIFL